MVLHDFSEKRRTKIVTQRTIFPGPIIRFNHLTAVGPFQRSTQEIPMAKIAKIDTPRSFGPMVVPAVLFATSLSARPNMIAKTDDQPTP